MTADFGDAPAASQPMWIWLLNRVVNPVVVGLLRSPLHPVLSGSVLVLTYRGRQTGKLRSLPVQYVRLEENYYIVPGNPAVKTWWRNLRGGAPVQLRVNGKNVESRAELISNDDPEFGSGLSAYRERFGASAGGEVTRSESVSGAASPDATLPKDTQVIVRAVPMDDQRGQPGS